MTTTQQTTTHTLPTGREHTFEGEHIYRVTFQRTLDDEACAQLRAAGRSVPSLDDGNPNEETIDIAADEPTALNEFHPAANRAHMVSTLVLRGHGCATTVEIVA